MLPKKYIEFVKQDLYLPPLIRRRELKLLQEEIKQGLEEGRNIQHVEQWMEEPEQKAAMILSRYPSYHQSNFLFLAHLLFFSGLYGIKHFIEVDDQIRLQKFFNESGSFFGEEYMISQGDAAAQAALAAEPAILNSLHTLSPREGFIFCSLVILFSMVCWFWLKYVPESQG